MSECVCVCGVRACVYPDAHGAGAGLESAFPRGGVWESRGEGREGGWLGAQVSLPTKPATAAETRGPPPALAPGSCPGC